MQRSFHALAAWSSAAVFACALLISPAPPPALASAQTVRAQTAPCGVVDALDYPIDISDTLTNRYDDFALYRERFGGRHTGIDVAFNRHGDPVYAAARGLVTYANPEGWDTEKGVVIVQHTFPDGGIYYTLYGHMEQTDDIHFPPVGVCVERGDVVGVVGWPSRGLPHLHYEIRNFLPDDGGPGYVIENPLFDGWYNPLDFTDMWRLRLAPGFVDSVSYLDVPSLPPVLLDDGVTVIATVDQIEAFSAAGVVLWRVATDGVITGITGLPGNGIAAHTRTGQALTLRSGRFEGVWNVPGPDAPVVVLGDPQSGTPGDTLVFVTDEGGLAAYDPKGVERWSLPGGDDVISVIDFTASGNQDQVALGVRVPGGVKWRLVDSGGAVVRTTTFSRTPLIAPIPSGGWLILDDTVLYRVDDGVQRQIGVVSPPPGRTARLTADLVGSAYLYLGDPDSTLLSISATGATRWRAAYPSAPASLAPMLRTDDGCLLYALDADGMLNVFSASSGDLLVQKQLYAGGIQNGSPRARLLQPQADHQILISAGFLSTVTLDGAAISGSTLDECVLG